MGRKEAIKKEINLSLIPKYTYNEGKIRYNWKECNYVKVKGIYENYSFEFIIEKYDDNKKKLKIIYQDKEFYVSSKGIINCQFGNIFKIITSDFKYEIGKVIKDYDNCNNIKRHLIITDRKKDFDNFKQLRKYYKIKCLLCNFDSSKHWSIQDKEYKDEYWIEESCLSHGQNCPCCSISSRVIVTDINSIYKTDKWMILYIGEECAKTHTHGSHDKVEVVCPDCGHKKTTVINKVYNRHSIGCRCGDGFSYGHKYIFNLLTQLKQEFIDNYTFDWCKFYNPYKQKEVIGEYDFVLENIKLIIEVDGGFHRRDNDMSGQTKEESIFIDNEKDRLALENGYKVIRISDEGDIKQNVLDSRLNELFDLNNIDWLECEVFALSNRVKEACEYKKNNPNMTTSDIGEAIKCSRSTIHKWLINGSKLGWCNYNPKLEKEKAHNKSGLKAIELNSKPIKMYDKNMNFIKMFFNSKELEKQSESLFKIRLTSSGARSVCTGTQKQYKDHIFKYATQEEYKEWVEQNKLEKVI